ncbi:MAG: Bax inhibitor-1/YccA family protein [Cytophagales bacterium]
MNKHLSYRTGNPVLTSNAFNIQSDYTDKMTIGGTVNKTFLSLLILVGSAYYSWTNIGIANILLLPSILISLIVAFITIRNKHWSPTTVPIYAVLQGIFLGVISNMFNSVYEGIVITAVSYTLCILFALLSIYRLGLIKATENFKLGIGAATGGILLLYIINFGMSFFGSGIPLMNVNNASMMSIGFSVFVIIIAALSLVVDFDFIEEGAEKGAPKYMEWFGAFGLMVTLVWLYLEILKLLAKLNSRK